MVDGTDQQHLINAVKQINVYVFIEVCLLNKLTRIHHILLEECSTGELHHEGEHHLWVLYHQHRGAISGKFRLAIPFEQGRFQSTSNQPSYAKRQIAENRQQETNTTRHRFV